MLICIKIPLFHIKLSADFIAKYYIILFFHEEKAFWVSTGIHHSQVHFCLFFQSWKFESNTTSDASKYRKILGTRKRTFQTLSQATCLQYKSFETKVLLNTTLICSFMKKRHSGSVPVFIILKYIFVSFSNFVNLKVTQLLIGSTIWFSQSEVLLSNASKYRKILGTRKRTFQTLSQATCLQYKSFENNSIKLKTSSANSLSLEESKNLLSGLG